MNTSKQTCWTWIGTVLAALILAGCATATTASAPATTAGGQPTAPKEYHFGDIVDVAPDTLMVVGRPLDMKNGEGDLANSVLYKTNDTIYWIDSGGTKRFEELLRSAFDRLKPYKKVVLINTHGHSDHVGNNALLNELGASSVEHYISQSELATMRQQVDYFVRAFAPIAPYVDTFKDPRPATEKLLSLYEPMNTETGVITTLESLPLESLTIGDARWTGWSLGHGDVQVLRTQGHTTGSVAVYIPGIKLLHLGDEDTGYYPAFPGHDLVKNHTVFDRSLTMIDHGAVAILTDGHTHGPFDAQQAKAFLEKRIVLGIAYDKAIHRILSEHPQGITIPDLITAASHAPELTSLGAEPSPMFDSMQVVGKLDELGITPSGDDPTTATVALPTHGPR